MDFFLVKVKAAKALALKNLVRFIEMVDQALQQPFRIEYHTMSSVIDNDD